MHETRLSLTFLPFYHMIRWPQWIVTKANRTTTSSCHLSAPRPWVTSGMYAVWWLPCHVLGLVFMCWHVSASLGTVLSSDLLSLRWVFSVSERSGSVISHVRCVTDKDVTQRYRRGHGHDAMVAFCHSQSQDKATNAKKSSECLGHCFQKQISAVNL